MSASVSVIIPAYNGALYLAEAVASALAQTRIPKEVLVIDDGSTDATSEIGRAAGATVWRIEHQGVSVARNTGVERSTADYIAFLDADDTWHPRKLELQAQLLDSRPEVGIAMCRHTYAVEGAAPAWFRGPQDGSVASGSLPIASLIRRTTWERVGPFDPTLTHGEDGDWFFRATDLGVVAALVDLPLMTYRIHASNASGHGAGVRDGILRTLRESVRRKQAAR
jgi:glycosyltransferase involved in cell wall biosynthesis